jgi:hypothetical protein
MAIKFTDVLELFEFVNFGSPFCHEGYICKTTGKTYFYSDFGDNEPLPDDIDNTEQYLAIPYKNDLGLGRDLVFEFIQSYLPSQYDKVRSIFRGKGAYQKFKGLLEQANLLDTWHEFEVTRTQHALRAWTLMQQVE